MAVLSDVRRLALALPEVQERTSSAGLVSWVVRGVDAVRGLKN